MEWSGGRYPYAFGGDGSGMRMDPELTETVQFVKLMEEYGVGLICATIGSPYYNVHMQRPAYYPVSDGYLMPEHPLYNVSRHLEAVRELKKRCPEMLIVGSGYTVFRSISRMPPSMPWRTARRISPASGAWCSLIRRCARIRWTGRL